MARWVKPSDLFGGTSFMTKDSFIKYVIFLIQSTEILTEAPHCRSAFRAILRRYIDYDNIAISLLLPLRSFKNSSERS